MRYLSFDDPPPGGPERIGVLLVNSGTPASPRPADVRRFLAGLLADPRVVDAPRGLWLPLLHGVILNTRPFRSARKYRRIWTSRGSPLLTLSEDLRTRIERELTASVLAPVTVSLGMLYGRPSVSDALADLRRAGAQQILIVPLYPQYCGASTGAVFDQLSREIARWRAVPDLRFVGDYHQHPSYVEALRVSVIEHWTRHGRGPHLVLSFHGIPERYARGGDPYERQCYTTARLLADELGLDESQWTVSFQSKYGPGRWLAPSTAHVLEALPKRGTSSVIVVCPGFAVDCLETLDEINIENRERFLAAGGVDFHYVSALNARVEHARAIADLIAQHCQGWTTVDVAWLAADAAQPRRVQH